MTWNTLRSLVLRSLQQEQLRILEAREGYVASVSPELEIVDTLVAA
jgi:hypothetical protein